MRAASVGVSGDRRGMTTSQSDFQLNRPGALIAALPAVLGFVPEKSLVLVTVDRGEMGCVMRVDLSPELTDSVGHLAEVAAAARPGRRDRGRRRRRGRRLPDVQRRIPRPARRRCSDALPTMAIELLAFHVVDRVDRRRAVALPRRQRCAAPSTTRRRRRWRWRRCWTVAGSTRGATSCSRSSRSPTLPRATALAGRDPRPGRRRGRCAPATSRTAMAAAARVADGTTAVGRR